MFEYLIIIIIVMLLGIGVLLYRNSLLEDIKSPLVKKNEICENYTKQLKDILKKCNNQEDKIAQKKLFLQKCNSELSRNIFFTEQEAKELVQKLAQL